METVVFWQYRKMNFFNKRRKKKDGNDEWIQVWEQRCAFHIFVEMSLLFSFLFSSSPLILCSFFPPPLRLFTSPHKHKNCVDIHGGILLHCFICSGNHFCDKCALLQSLSPLSNVTPLPPDETRCLGMNLNYLQTDLLVIHPRFGAKGRDQSLPG